MTEHCYCGIDVAKDRLDAQVLPHRQRFSVDNNATGWAELVERLHALPIAAVGIEPSGGYERGIIRTLLAAGLSVRRINPSKLRQFARARGILAKNDRLDAQLIAEYVSIMPTRVVRDIQGGARLLAELLCGRSLYTRSTGRGPSGFRAGFTNRQPPLQPTRLQPKCIELAWAAKSSHFRAT